MLTHSLKSSFVKEFFRSLTDPRSVNKYFMFYGGLKPRTNEQVIPSVLDTVEYENSVKREIAFFNYILPSDVSLMIPRYDWTSGMIYDQYEDDIDLINGKKFYSSVLEDNEFRVYLCLSNNSGAASTSPPTGTSTQEIETSDGYIWKYMYSLTEAMEKFLTEQFMPIVEIDSVSFNDERALALDVKLDAIGGFIEKITIDSTSPLYTDLVNPSLTNSHTVTTATGLTFTAPLVGNLATSSNYYNNNYIVYFDSGKVGTVKTYTISGSNITIELCEIYPESDTENGLINTGDRYSILPKVNIVGNGYGAVAVPVFQNNILVDLNIINGGTGYNYANAYVMSGDDIDVSVVIPPDGGFGFDLINELKPKHLMIKKDFKYSQIPSGKEKFFANSSAIRQYGIVKNIKTSEDFVVPNDYQSFNMSMVVDPDVVINGQDYYLNDVLDFNIGTLIADATHIIGADTFSSAKIDDIGVSPTNDKVLELKLSEVNGVFENAVLNQSGQVSSGEKILFVKKVQDSDGVSNQISVVYAPKGVYVLTQSFDPINLPINLRTSSIQKIKLSRTGSSVLNNTIIPVGSYLYREATTTVDAASAYVVSMETETVVGGNSSNYIYILSEKGSFSLSDSLKCVKDPFAKQIELYNGTCAGNAGVSVSVSELASFYDDIEVNKYSGNVLYIENVEQIEMSTSTIFTTRILLGF